MAATSLFRTLVTLSIACTIPLLVKAACFSNAEIISAASEKAYPQALINVSEVEKVKQLVVSVDEVIVSGERGYMRSCVSCHDISPRDLPHHDRQQFVETVRNGAGKMPALGYKLNAVEAEMIRIYISSCTNRTAIC